MVTTDASAVDRIPTPRTSAHDDAAVFRINRMSVVDVVGAWADTVGLERSAVQVQRRGVTRQEDGLLVGFVRFTVVGVEFYAEFAPAMSTCVWLVARAGSGDGPALHLGPIDSWSDLETAANDAQDATPRRHTSRR